MKRYLAFHYDLYYPLGGMHDFIGDFDTEEAALEAVTQKEKDRYCDRADEFFSYTNAQIYDTETKTLIYDSEE